ncbi:MAG TPA: hypothetical protein VKY92_23365 [Verrucomicrobiae bacterium]|nr:hypothetical protein [Verrucomicrobiae bacterium]
MKNPRLSLCTRLAAACLCAGAFVSPIQAQTYTNIVITKFDGTEPFQNLFYWWGLKTFSTAVDPTVNATTTLSSNDPGSGSLKGTSDWTGTSGAGGGAPEPQLMVWNALAGSQWNSSVTVNGYYYDLNFDFMVDTNSARTTNGDFGHIRAGVTLNGWSQVTLWDVPAYTNVGWTHVHAYIDPTIPGIDTITGFWLNWPWQTDSANLGSIQGVQNFWVDNIIFSTNLTKPLNPPTATLKPAPRAITGLNINSIGSGQYDRNAIATVNPEGWVNATGPVTYSMTLSSYPGTNNPNFQSHIMLVPNPGTETAPDWNEPNAIVLDIQNQANGNAVANFRYKTNQPGGNSMLYGPGTLGSVTSTNGALGTWSMTFVSNTNVILTAPTGATNLVTFPDDQAVQSLFADPVIAYFGEQPNTTANIGQEVVISNIKITGTTSPINDSFTGTGIDTNTWNLRASQANDVFIPQNDAAYVLTWTLPDQNFNVEVAPSITGPWSDAGLTNGVIQGSTKSVTVTRSMLPAGKAAFFRLRKPVATKLQILLPGETAAPGTLTGKTGTPTAQANGVAFNVTVNAVDANWNVINYVKDTVHFTSPDSNATLPADGALANGTGTFSVTFGTAGSQTLTVSDLSDSKINSATSASVTVQ